MHRLLLLVCLLITIPAYALEIKAVKDDATVDAAISSRSLNRIFVTTDRIAETYGIEGSFKIEKDEELGNIYIIPIGFYKNNPFNLFLRTEHGHHYTLHLIPSDIEAQTIGIKPLTPILSQAGHWELNLPYENLLIQLIKDMAINQIPDGYAEIPLGNDQAEQLRIPLSFKLKTIYRGNRLEGQVWSVINMGSKEISLRHNHFRDGRILAISFDKRSLKQGEVAKLYWVKRYAA